MSNFNRALVLLLILTAGCARQRFATQWSLSPELTPMNATETEYDLRERERHQEVAVLNAEKTTLGQSLQDMYDLYVLRPVDPWLGHALDWSALTVDQRVDVARALDRIVVLARRQNLLTGRADANDPIQRRATNLRRNLDAWSPQPEAYYGH